MNANQQVNEFRPVTVAAPGTPCGWTYRDSETGKTLTCEGGKDAVHVLTQALPVAQAGTALCGYHSPFDVTDAERAKAMAEAERDEQSGLDLLREMLTLTPVPAAKPTKVKVVHAGDLGVVKTAACGRMVPEAQMTGDPSKVTCQRCKVTRRFANWDYRIRSEKAQAEFERAGLRRQMVIRETGGARRFGVVARLDGGMITVYFWTADTQGRTSASFTSAHAFDQACEITDLTKMIKVGDRLVSCLGGESVVLGVTPTSVSYRLMGDHKRIDETASEFAAELSRGFVAVIPTTKCRVCNKAISNTQDHKHFDRPMSWPNMPERPRGLYVRPDGTREAVTTDDMAQKGMRVTYGHGFADNGTVTAVTWHGVTIRRDKDGSHYILVLRDLLRQLNRGEVSTFMPDANGRPIGSWR